MSMSTHTGEVAPTRRPAPPAPSAPAAQPRVALVGVSIGASLVALTVLTEGWAPTVLVLLGVGLGFSLFHARFGFTSAWRQLVAVGQGKALRAHTLLLGATAVLFAPFLASGVSPTGAQVGGNVAPVGIALLLGATLFGLGMQIAGSCASGTLYAVGSGQTSILLALAGFVGGATLGAAHLGWWDTTPSAGAVNLAEVFGGVLGAVAVTLLLLSLIAALTVVIARRRNPPPVEPVATASGAWRVVRGAWPLWVGALALAVLNLGVLLVSGSPWGVTTAFSLWGSKAAGALGIAEPATWDFWSGSRAEMLSGSVLAEATGLTNLGIMIGAMIASALAGAFRLHRRVPVRLALGAVVGGLLMGYGARLAYGCNIGAYLGGIASQSLHGWVWGLMALVGTWFGLRARPWFGLSRPRPTDGTC
jgi:uncharacterized membrane protein YedE/YeeE